MIIITFKIVKRAAIIPVPMVGMKKDENASKVQPPILIRYKYDIINFWTLDEKSTYGHFLTAKFVLKCKVMLIWV